MSSYIIERQSKNNQQNHVPKNEKNVTDLISKLSLNNNNNNNVQSLFPGKKTPISTPRYMGSKSSVGTTKKAA